MSDEEYQFAGREARALSRSPESLRSWLETLIGQVLYIEGIRINYRGKLIRVIWGGDGKPEGLLMEKLERISYMTATGPNAGTTYVHDEERLVPWDCVHDIGKLSIRLGTGARWS